MEMEQFSSFVNKTTDEMLGVKGLEQENLNDMFHSYSPKSPTPTPTEINAGSVIYEYGYLYPDNTVGKALNDFFEQLNSKVEDVQIDGVSVVVDGVSNIPIATTNKLGVMKIGTGLTISNGWVSTVGANDAQIKAGTVSSLPIMPNRQHVSVFYGLAKAAGDSTQAQSLNDIGQYTETALSLIQVMLGIAKIIGNVEGTTASHAYGVGDAFLYGGALYKATTNIALNDAIVPETNCEQTTIINMVKGV